MFILKKTPHTLTHTIPIKHYWESSLQVLVNKRDEPDLVQKAEFKKKSKWGKLMIVSNAE